MPCKKEFDDIKWLDIDELKKDVKSNPEKYTTAVPKIIDSLEKEGK
jgi:hypothetical protein